MSSKSKETVPKALSFKIGLDNHNLPLSPMREPPPKAEIQPSFLFGEGHERGPYIYEDRIMGSSQASATIWRKNCVDFFYLYKTAGKEIPAERPFLSDDPLDWLQL